MSKPKATKKRARTFALTLDQLMEMIECIADNNLGPFERDGYVKAWIFDYMMRTDAGGKE